MTAVVTVEIHGSDLPPLVAWATSAGTAETSRRVSSRGVAGRRATDG